MPTFDITSEFNNQEITNAVDQAYREIAIDTILEILVQVLYSMKKR